MSLFSFFGVHREKKCLGATPDSYPLCCRSGHPLLASRRRRSGPPPLSPAHQRKPLDTRDRGCGGARPSETLGDPWTRRLSPPCALGLVPRRMARGEHRRARGACCLASSGSSNSITQGLDDPLPPKLEPGLRLALVEQARPPWSLPALCQDALKTLQTG